MVNPSYQPLVDVLIRIGWALPAGAFLGLVPWFWQRGHYTVVRRRRWVWRLCSLLSLLAFLGYGAYLRQNVLPHEDTPPDAPAAVRADAAAR